MQPSTPVVQVDINLPDELILKTLDHLELRPSLIRVSHVSQRWRALAISHPTFWKSITVCNTGGEEPKLSAYSLALAQLQSSQNPGIEVRLDVRPGQQTWDDPWATGCLDDELPKKGDLLLDLCLTIVQHLPRISSLCLAATHRVLTLMSDHSMFINLSPYLEQLELSVSPHDEGDPPFIFHWSSVKLMPRLRSLCLRRIDTVSISDSEFGLPLPYSYEGLQELVWRRSSSHTAIRGPVVDELLQRFPSLHTLQLLKVPRDLIPAPERLMARLAALRNLALSDGFMRLLDIARLSQVPRLRVRGASLSTIDKILEHFLNDQPPTSKGNETSTSAPSLEIDLRSSGHGWDGCPLSFMELVPGGRRRDFEIVASTWMPHVPAMPKIAQRVTKLSVRINDWLELFEALDGAPALEELVVRLRNVGELGYNSPMVRCPKLVSFVLQNGWEEAQPFPLVVRADELTALVERTFAPELIGQFKAEMSGCSS